ncbi:MAG: FkbM family methyltransferase [Deltaproteobacteria bacterium]|nr:FkbM family methyltransferase [Deltaproteobacteria bacterium]
MLQRGHDKGPRFLFVPSNGAHAQLMFPIHSKLEGSSFMLLQHDTENAASTLQKLPASVFSYRPGVLAELRPRVAIFGNDWGPQERQIVAEAQASGIPTVCIQEGCLDFADDKLRRMQQCDYAFLQGPVMLRYLDRPNTIVTGNPKYDSIQEQTFDPERPIMINCNFTYGVYEEVRESWVREAVEACRSLGRRFFISQHPRDRGAFPPEYPVKASDASSISAQLAETSVVITRFSTVIYEALMLGVRAIYFNPHGEPFGIFQQDETGAVPVAQDQSELLALLRLALTAGDDDPVKRRQFLLSHCATLNGDAAERCADAIRAIAEKRAGGVSSNQVRIGTQHQAKEYRLPRVRDQLPDCSKAELIERAKVHLQSGRIADAADCIHLGRERYPSSAGFEAAWNELQSTLGGQIPEHRSWSATEPALPLKISAADLLKHPSVQAADELVEQIDRGGVTSSQRDGYCQRTLPPYRERAARLRADSAEETRGGEALAVKGNLGAAEAAFSRALELYPGSADALNDMGVLHWQCGRREEALECLSRAVSSEPDHRNAVENYALVLEAIGDEEQAARLCRSYLRRHPTDAKLRDRLAGLEQSDAGRPDHFSELDLILRYPYARQSARTLVDVGANVGVFSRALAERDWRVLAFEPEPENFRGLTRNLERFAGAHCVPRAVSDVPAQAVPFYVSSIHSGIHALKPFHPSHAPSLTVETVRLDEFLSGKGIDEVTVLKIDVEGADFPALKSFDFERWRPELVMCEYMDERTLEPWGYDHHDLVRHMARYGYAAFISEWAEIIEYSRRDVRTVPHRFLRCVRYPLDHSPAWGNLIFVPEGRVDDFARTLESYLRERAAL